MDAASTARVAGRGRRAVATLCLTGTLAILTACQDPAPLQPITGHAAARHPIQPSIWDVVPTPTTVAPDTAVPARITPGPNARVSPTPGSAPRVEPAPRAAPPSSRDALEALQRDLQQQKRAPQRPEPGPPAGTIDLRPGTIRTTPGTIEVPN